MFARRFDDVSEGLQRWRRDRPRKGRRWSVEVVTPQQAEAATRRSIPTVVEMWGADRFTIFGSGVGALGNPRTPGWRQPRRWRERERPDYPLPCLRRDTQLGSLRASRHLRTTNCLVPGMQGTSAPCSASFPSVSGVLEKPPSLTVRGFFRSRKNLHYCRCHQVPRRT